jgi:hypothetical protein
MAPPMTARATLCRLPALIELTASHAASEWPETPTRPKVEVAPNLSPLSLLNQLS